MQYSLLQKQTTVHVKSNIKIPGKSKYIDDIIHQIVLESKENLSDLIVPVPINEISDNRNCKNHMLNH